MRPAVPDDPHHFDFDLDRGIRAQVVEKLESSPLLPLNKNIGPPASGIYALYHKDQLVYLGKASKGATKSKRTLKDRLNEHVGKIIGRQNIALTEMRCRYLTFSSEWWAFAAELALISHYNPEWNASGFGSKMPGAGRPGTHRVSPWDSLYPKRSLTFVCIVGCRSQSSPLRHTIQKQWRLRAWCASFHLVETIGPVRTLMIRSQTENPVSSAIRMKSQCGHFDLWLFTMSVILASSRPSGLSTRLACFKNGGYR